MRPGISKNFQYRMRKKGRILAAQNGCCKYCGKPLAIKKATFDHVVPKALGGVGAQTNLVVACRPCNEKKANKPPHIWYAELMTEKAA